MSHTNGKKNNKRNITATNMLAKNIDSILNRKKQSNKNKYIKKRGNNNRKKIKSGIRRNR